MRQTWYEILFAHWAVSDDAIAALLPPTLEADRFDGRAWVGITPFVMSGLRLRDLPAIPRLSMFPEVMVRTYVTRHGVPAIYFLSLEAGRSLAALGGRPGFYLPHHPAAMTFQRLGESVTFSSARISRRHPAAFAATYAPTGLFYQPREGSLEQWFTERHCFFTRDEDQKLWRTEIQNRPWRLQEAEGKITKNTLAAAAGIDVPDSAPVLHCSRRQDVAVWNIEEEATAPAPDRHRRART